MISLSVTVSGGIPPIDIRVSIDNLDNTDDLSYVRPGSFSQPHELPKGKYILIVTGMNPESGSTTIDLSGDFETEPSPSTPLTRSTKTYSVPFFFTI